MQQLQKITNGNIRHRITSTALHRLPAFYLIVSCFCIGTSVLAISSTMLIAHHNLTKDDLQIGSIERLLQSVDWWNNYQAHKVREKIYNMEIDNLNISLQESPSPEKQQIFAKYLFLDKDLHDDQYNEDSLHNLKDKAEAYQEEHLALEDDVAKNSEFIINYEFITIFLIVAASLAGISEIAKNKLLGYSAFCIGGAGCLLLVLTLTAGITLSQLVLAPTTETTLPVQSEHGNSGYDTQGEQLQAEPPKQSIFYSSPSVLNSSSSVDLNEMYHYCLDSQKLITEGCDSLFQSRDNTH